MAYGRLRRQRYLCWAASGSLGGIVADWATFLSCTAGKGPRTGFGRRWIGVCTTCSSRRSSTCLWTGWSTRFSPIPKVAATGSRPPTLVRELSSRSRARTYCKNTASRSQKVLGARLDRRVADTATRRSRRCWTAKPGGSARTPVNACRSSVRTSTPSTGERDAHSVAGAGGNTARHRDARSHRNSIPPPVNGSTIVSA